MSTMSSNWVTDETLRPSDPRPPMRDWDRTRTTTAGNSVSIGARADRKMRSNRTMIRMNESVWVCLPSVADWALFATAVATAPASSIRSPGAWKRPRTVSSLSTRVLTPAMSFGAFLDSTTSCAALASGETPANCTRSTLGTRRSAPANDSRVDWSMAFSEPAEDTATTWTRDWLDGPVSGSARLAAWLDGALAGRNALLLLLTWLPRLGSAREAAPVPTSQSTSTTHR